MPTRPLNIAHVTHEAVVKMGGIGTVLEGLLTSSEYDDAVERTLLLCPLFTTHGDVDSRLGLHGEVLYSSIDGRVNDPHAAAFRDIESFFHVRIIYGRRLLKDPLTGREARPEVALIDVGHMNLHEVSVFKHRLFDHFGLDSRRFEDSWDYEQYVRLAEPAMAVVRALGFNTGDAACLVVGHEFMGMPAALAAKSHPEWGIRAAYHAHETPSARRIVEEHPAHDTMFYNVLSRGEAQGLYLPDLFGDQSHYYRHALAEASRHLDVTFAVGDYVIKELRMLSREMAGSNIKLVYNGIPAHNIAPDEAEGSKRRLQDYAETLLGDRPDYVFTHVTRLTASKGLWRDVRVMNHLERALRKLGKTAVLFVLSTEIGGPRRREDILLMERTWNWPVAHREGLPDLSGGEALFYQGVQVFNARARNSKIIFINQFGFDRLTCGQRMPKEMTFLDIRQGSDVEFGQSIYEPFGIAQVEALSFGSMCVMSSVCGCRFFVEKVAGREGAPNVVVADYTAYRATPDTIDTYKNLKREDREAFAETVAADVADQIIKRLPKTLAEKSEFLRRGYELARQMSWDVITRDYLLPAIVEVLDRDPRPSKPELLVSR
ncbi:MAG TPA: hypothetical protein VNT79_01605 [Phycisphaerae bacterium]|nr:hypothetical protein [Phycisphaerae bacterium]